MEDHPSTAFFLPAKAGILINFNQHIAAFFFKEITSLRDALKTVKPLK
jgi:hypothetical protein